MQSLWPMAVAGLAMIAIGVWQLCAPLDVLWTRQERYLMARGLTPERNAVWENNARRSGGILIVLGVVVLLIPAMLQASIPPKMSGVSIDGRELTQQEWDGCHHDLPACLSQYVTPHQ